MLQIHLHNYDYILFIDSDAIFIDFSYTIEKELVSLLNNEKSIIFQEDIWETTHPTTDRICTGLIFVKKCPESFAILNEWARSPYTNPKCLEMRYKHPREQECISYLIKTNDDMFISSI